MVAQPSQPDSDAQSATSLVSVIRAKILTLPVAQQRQVLDFVEFLAQRYSEPIEASSATQATVWDTLRTAAARIPDEERNQMPTDGSLHHDHYLYGTPKHE